MAIYNHGLPIRIKKVSGTNTSADTVTPDTMLKGITAHDATGQEITGTHVCESGSFCGTGISTRVNCYLGISASHTISAVTTAVPIATITAELSA